MTVSDYAANVVSWTAVAFAIILTGLRLHVRATRPRGYHWDDLAHVLALVFLLVEVSTFHIAVGLSDEIAAYEAHRTDTKPDYAKFQILLLVWRSMVWSCVWAVKIGYLLLYRHMFGDSSKTFMKWWWAVLAFTFLSYWAALAPTFIYCGGSISNVLNEDICDSPEVDRLQYRYLTYGAILNIVSDIAIMILPLAMLRRMSLSRLQKFGLGVIFSLSFVEITVEIVRVAESDPNVSNEPVNFLVTTLESSVAVWISCVPSLHYLFKRALRDTATDISGETFFARHAPITARITRNFSVQSSRVQEIRSIDQVAAKSNRDTFDIYIHDLEHGIDTRSGRSGSSDGNSSGKTYGG